MAELFRKIIDGHTLYAIWKISESVEELRSAIRLREEEETLYQSFVAESRKKQWLAYRLLIRELLKPDEFPVEYDVSGKPFLAGSDFHISVTHTDDLAAVIISCHARVGIDMEKIRPRIEKVREKFLNPEESALIGKEWELEQLTLAWCAKEALYKLYGQRNLDFRDNIFVDIPAKAGMKFIAEIRFSGKRDKYQLFSELNGDYILVYLLDAAI
ncbi:MAG: 4'-phosphopantetheinyl transferase superfamily protein [Bacteroidales bacterium]|nr:4'-phosphopantetheinyl transferase superfamily protein [Bacteroidales bacterium]